MDMYGARCIYLREIRTRIFKGDVRASCTTEDKNENNS